MTKPLRILKKIRIDEISLVDKPAMEGARIVLIKRDEPVAKHMPSPDEGESKSKFVSRFMGDDVMKSEYPDENQRLAVAYSKWGDVKKAAFSKQAQLLSEVDGHTHLLDDTCMDNHTSYEKAPEDEYGHAHPWVRNSDGSITIGAVDGHTHELTAQKREFSSDERDKLAEEGEAMPDGSFPIKTAADLENALHDFGRADESRRKAVAHHIARRAKALGLSDKLPSEGAFADELGKAAEGQESTTMTDAEKAAIDAANKRAESLETELKIQKSINGLNTAERTHFDSLNEQDRTAFLAKSALDRKAEMERSANDNPVVFTNSDGVEFRKNDGAKLIAIAKQADADRKLARDATAALTEQALQKRASDDLGNLPGEMNVKTALLKAVDGIADEATRKSALALLKAGNDGIAKAFKRAGTTSIPSHGGDAAEQLESLAKRHAEQHKVSIEQARVDVLGTPEGERLYDLTQAR